MKKPFVPVLATLLLAASCGSEDADAPAPIPTPKAKARPDASPTPTATATPTPTPSPTPTATPTAVASASASPATPPEATLVILSDTTSVGVTVTWLPTTDDTTPAQDIAYRVFVTPRSLVSTPQDVVTHRVVVGDWTTASTSKVIDGLAPATTYFVSVVARDAQGNASAPAVSAFTTSANTAPTVGTAISIPAAASQTALRVDLGAATDVETPAALLEYKLVTAATAAELDTIAEAQAAATVHAWAALPASGGFDVTGLARGQETCYATLVRDAHGGVSLYAPVCAHTKGLRLFASTSTYTGAQIGGVAGADAKCTADPRNTSGTTFKAVIVAGATRRACTSGNCASGGIGENVDWVLKPNTRYVNTLASDALTFKTNAAAIVPFPSQFGDFMDSAPSAVTTWTGMNPLWTSYGGGDCDAWTTTSGVAGRGIENRRNSEAFSGTSVAGCNEAHALLCVEQ